MAVFHATAQPPSLTESYAYCADLARSHYENFTVISRFTPKRHRPALEAVYAFCRHTDDLGDEAGGDRLALLDEWEAELDRALTPASSAGQAPTPSQRERGPEGPTHPIMVALQDVVMRCKIPEEPFHKLIEANRMDQGSGRFETYDDVLHYCDHSANPVGRMVLHVLGAATGENVRLSDATCTALQLANFWQDVARDYAMGRIYIPLEDMRAFGCTEKQIATGVADGAFRDLMRFEVDRAQTLFEEGLPLATRLSGRARLAVALFSRGGLRVLDAIRKQSYDVLSNRPVVTRSPEAVAHPLNGRPVDRIATPMTTTTDRSALDAAYEECQAITKREARNFYYAFLTLPHPRRRAIYAAYAFSRLADDIADGDGAPPRKRKRARSAARTAARRLRRTGGRPRPDGARGCRRNVRHPGVALPGHHHRR